MEILHNISLEGVYAEDKYPTSTMGSHGLSISLGKRKDRTGSRPAMLGVLRLVRQRIKLRLKTTGKDGY
jgi:hypothetical protein